MAILYLLYKGIMYIYKNFKFLSNNNCFKKIVENINPKNVKGIGFDATCSLVALDTKGLPLTVSPTGIVKKITYIKT